MKMGIGYTDRSKSSVMHTNWTQLYWADDNSLGESTNTLNKTTDTWLEAIMEASLGTHAM